jgi:hypothetical protein
MIMSETIGSRTQIDLVDMTRRPDGAYLYALRYVDHHSGFSCVAPVTHRIAKNVDLELVKILSTAIMPKIL